ncbi:unnamed protein product, partial [Meganyctiphanes norvegica]
NKCFAQERTLAKHMMIHTGKRPYQCSHCGKGFIQSSDLTRHMKTHCWENLNKERPYQCSQCDKAFSQNGTLKRHMKTHTRENSFLPNQNMDTDKLCEKIVKVKEEQIESEKTYNSSVSNLEIKEEQMDGTENLRTPKDEMKEEHINILVHPGIILEEFN